MTPLLRWSCLLRLRLRLLWLRLWLWLPEGNLVDVSFEVIKEIIQLRLAYGLASSTSLAPIASLVAASRSSLAIILSVGLVVWLAVVLAGALASLVAPHRGTVSRTVRLVGGLRFVDEVDVRTPRRLRGRGPTSRASAGTGTPRKAFAEPRGRCAGGRLGASRLRPGHALSGWCHLLRRRRLALTLLLWMPLLLLLLGLGMGLGLALRLLLLSFLR